MAKLLCYYGLRIGELVGLKKGDFDFDNNTLTIRRTIAVHTLSLGRAELSPKTERSNRILILMPGIKELIDESLDEDDFIFPQEGNKSLPMWEMTVRRRMRKYMKRVGLPIIKIHEFRHSCASNLLRAGIPLRVVARWIGDKESTVLDYYSHMFLDEVACVPKLLINEFKIEGSELDLDKKIAY